MVGVAHSDYKFIIRLGANRVQHLKGAQQRDIGDS